MTDHVRTAERAPPLRSMRARAMVTTIDALPLVLLRLIFVVVPVDARARAACVRRAWRDALRDASLWTALDVSRAAGLTASVTETFLRGAVARAGGWLKRLDVSGCSFPSLTPEGFARAVSGAGALRELRVSGLQLQLGRFDFGCVDSHAVLKTLASALPALTVLECDATSYHSADALQLLRNEPPLGALQMHSFLLVRLTTRPSWGHDWTVQSALEVAAAVATCRSLTGLALHQCTILHEAPAFANALIDAALTRGLTTLAFEQWCELSDAALLALARLLHGGALEELRLREMKTGVFAPHAAAALACALNDSRTLQVLILDNVGRTNLWMHMPVLLAALTGHPTLRQLSLCNNGAWDDDMNAAVGAALAALIAANAPSLTSLRVIGNRLRDAALGPILDALRRNTHLRALNLAGHCASPQFVRHTLAPAVAGSHGVLRAHF